MDPGVLAGLSPLDRLAGTRPQDGAEALHEHQGADYAEKEDIDEGDKDAGMTEPAQELD